MLKKLLIVLVLLTSSVNANFFEKLKDTVKALEEQSKLNNEESDITPTISSEQKSVPKFNSLAEEAAYKKQQEEEKLNQSNGYANKVKTTIIPRLQKLRISEEDFYQKYLLKENDIQEIIDEKYKNRTQLFNALQKDLLVLNSEREYLYRFFDDNGYQDGMDKIRQENFKKISWGNELYSILTNAAADNPKNYIVQCSSRQDDIYIDWRTGGMNFENLDSYEKYLRCAYHQREEKIVDKAKKDEMQKDQKIRLANEQKERQKVQKACQTWKAKAKKDVYSLGVGEQIVSKGMIFIIRGVEANTFFINVGGSGVYIQKSECVPYSSIKIAPSKYCYQ